MLSVCWRLLTGLYTAVGLDVSVVWLLLMSRSLSAFGFLFCGVKLVLLTSHMNILFVVRYTFDLKLDIFGTRYFPFDVVKVVF